MSKDQEVMIDVTVSDFEPVVVEWIAVYSETSGEIIDAWLEE